MLANNFGAANTYGPLNLAPTADAGEDQIGILGGTIVTLNGTGSFDPRGDDLTYQWSAPPGVLLDDATAAKPTFVAPVLSTGKTLVFTLVVTDGEFTSDPVTVSIGVLPSQLGSTSGEVTNVFERRSQIGKSEVYEVDLSGWTGEEPLERILLDVNENITLLSYGSKGSSVLFFAEGVNVGLGIVEVEVFTATRSRRFKLGVYVNNY